MIEKEKEKRDVIANNRKTDLSEYKRIVEVLGEDKAPVSFPQFQKMKYNDLEGYERLKDRVFIQNNFNKGIWLDKINQEKQARHMQASAGVGKSYFYDDVDVEELYNKYKMTGVLKITKSGAYGNREKITLTADLHLGIDVYTKKDINAITIHYSKTGVHLIPTYYEN